jgi:hypothetical protein
MYKILVQHCIYFFLTDFLLFQANSGKVKSRMKVSICNIGFGTPVQFCHEVPLQRIRIYLIDVPTFDIFAGFQGMKAPFIKFRKAFENDEKRLCTSAGAIASCTSSERGTTNLNTS